MKRRSALAAGAGLATLCAGGLLAACAAPSPPTRWYSLAPDPPLPVPASADAARAPVWEVSRRVGLPGALDRSTLMRVLPDGALQALPGHLWAEPLRESVPRVLVQDLRHLRGPTRVWAAPAPPGVRAAAQLRVDVLALQLVPGGGQLRLQAQWELVDLADAAQPPRVGTADLQLPVADAGESAQVAAHRLALWRLAERIAAF